MEHENVSKIIEENEQVIEEAKNAKENVIVSTWKKFTGAIKNFITKHPWLTVLICLAGGAGLLFLGLFIYSLASKDDVDIVEGINDPTNTGTTPSDDNIDIDINI